MQTESHEDENPINLPIKPTEGKYQKALIVAASIAVSVLLGGSAGAAAHFLLKQPDPVPTDNVVRIDPNAVPAGWKKYTSKKFGVSFITPEKWQVTEIDPQAVSTGGSGAFGDTISVLNPDDHSGSYDIHISKAQLDGVIKEITDTASKAGYKVTTKSLKWQGYDATETSVDTKDSDGKTVTSRKLYVQISRYVLTVPDKSDTPKGVMDKVVTQDVYSRFASSINVDDKIVAAQAKQDELPDAIPTAKDIVLGTVVVPSGWKKVQSQKYGISFAIPSAWAETEQYNTPNGSAMGLSVGSSSKYENQMSMKVSSLDLDTYVNQSTYLYGTLNSEAIVKTYKLKWQGYDARRVTVHLGTQKQDSSYLYVRVGNYTYDIPDPEGDQSDVVVGSFDSDTYKAFVKTIRITES